MPLSPNPWITPYNFAMAEGFQEVIEGAGGECVVNHPLNAYAGMTRLH